MFRTEDAKSDRPLRSITSARGADAGVGSPHDWLDELLASHEVSACVIEVCRNAGQIDYLFQAASPAFGRSTGLTDVVGRSMRALRPDHEEFWFELFQRVATTGEPACFEHVASALDRLDSFVNQLVRLVELYAEETGGEQRGALSVRIYQHATLLHSLAMGDYRNRIRILEVRKAAKRHFYGD